MVFILNGLIGEGGFGKVMTAKYDVTQQWYAVKEITKVSYDKRYRESDIFFHRWN